jgi:hypothetical protein
MEPTTDHRYRITTIPRNEAGRNTNVQRGDVVTSDGRPDQAGDVRVYRNGTYMGWVALSALTRLDDDADAPDKDPALYVSVAALRKAAPLTPRDADIDLLVKIAQAIDEGV